MVYQTSIAATPTCVLQCVPRKTPDSVLEEETPDSVDVPGMLHTAQAQQ